MKTTSTRKQAPSDPISRYISAAMKAAEQYKIDIETGKITAAKWIRLAVQRSRNDQQRTDIEFNKEAVERAFKLLYFIRISNGIKFIRFVPSPYQCWIISELFGWYYTSGIYRRRYRYALLYTARKTGKTVFVVAIEIIILVYDNQQSPEAYLCATTREQAGQALKYTKEIVLESPSLRSRLKVQQFQILNKKNHGKLKVLANTPGKNDSLNPSIFIMDEMHAHKTLEFFNVMKSGMVMRTNPLGLITSTAGFNKDYPFYLMLETAKQVLEGSVQDDITFYALYTLDDDDDVEDTSTWIKANPNLGVTVTLDSLKAEWEKAKLTITEKNNFITKNLNRYLDGQDQWIPDDIYVTAFNEVTKPTNRPKGYMGIDMSSTRDFAAISAVWEDEETGRLKQYTEFHFPQNETGRIRANGIDLRAWMEKGHIVEHPTERIDQKIMFESVARIHEWLDIQQLNYDEWNTGFIISEIESKLYIFCKPFKQTPVWFSFPLKYIEGRFFDRTLDMGTNTVMRWMFRNIVLYKDGNGNIKIMKNKSLDSVDGPVAFAMAVAAWLQNNSDTTAEFFRQLMGKTTPGE